MSMWRRKNKVLQAARNFSDQADQLEREGQFKAALTIRALASAALAQFGVSEDLAREKAGLAKLHAIDGNDQSAESFYREALSDYETLGHPEGQLRTLSMLASFLEGRERLAECKTVLAKAKTVAQSLGRSGEDVHAENTLGLQAHERGDLAKAQLHYNNAITLAKVLGYQRALGVTYANLGLVRREQGSLDVAEALFAVALRIAEDSNEPGRMAFALENLGYIARDRGNRAGAVTLLRRAAKIHGAFGHTAALNQVNASLNELSAD